MTGNPIIGSRVTLATGRAGGCRLLFLVDRARCIVKNEVLEQAVTLQVSCVSDETLPREHRNSIVPGSLLV